MPPWVYIRESYASLGMIMGDMRRIELSSLLPVSLLVNAVIPFFSSLSARFWQFLRVIWGLHRGWGGWERWI